MRTQENRKHSRQNRSLPVRLGLQIDVGKNEVDNRHKYEVLAYNVSEGGLALEVCISDRAVAQKLINRNIGCELELPLVDCGVTLKTKSEVAWVSQITDILDNRYQIGMRFVSENGFQASLKKYISENPINRRDNLDVVTLLINGEDVDTGRYEYFPYSDKYISDFRATYKIIHQLKKGEYPDGYEEYVFAKYAVGDDSLNEHAIKSAYDAGFIFKKTPLSVRRKILEDIHNLLILNRDEIVRLLVIEGHAKKLAEWEFLGMERAYTKETLDYYQSEMSKEIRVGDEIVRLVRKPDGVVCVSPPKNASCSNSLLAAFALLAGNTIVIKPPLKCPISTIYLWRNVIHRALQINGAPAGVVNIILGNSKKITEQWLSSPFVSDIVYFGDSETGLEIGKAAYMCGKKAILELSGNDQFFVWKDADLEKAAQAFLDGFLGSTQICMVPKNAIVHVKAYDGFVAYLKKSVEKMKVGLPSSEETLLTPVIKMAEYFVFLNDAIQKGAKLICGGNRLNYNGEKDSSGVYVEPTLLTVDCDVALSLRVVKEENFFPLLPLIRVTGQNDEHIYEQMISFSDLNQYGLRTSVWVSDEAIRERFSNDISNTGLLKINTRHVGFSSYTSTHGGTKKSGGPYGEMNYLWQKTSHLQGISIRER